MRCFDEFSEWEVELLNYSAKNLIVWILKYLLNSHDAMTWALVPPL